MNLKKYRKAAGLKQKDIAERIGIAQATYCNIENKKRNPSVNTLLKIANILSCTVNELLYDEQGACKSDDADHLLVGLSERPTR